MMSLIADQNNKEGKAYGQECKESLMCLPSRSSAPPPPTVEEKEAEMEREAEKEIETVKREDARQDVLQENITCLLYTSPSPRDLSTSRMPSSA